MFSFWNQTCNVTVNGAKTNLNELERGAQIQIYSMKTRSIKVALQSIPDGIVLDMKNLYFQIKVQRSHVEISAPFLLRSKVCGLCGDYDHETNNEFRSHDGSILSSGKLMAESFKVIFFPNIFFSNYEVKKTLI